MNRLSEKTRGLLVVYTARSHCGFSRDAENAKEDFTNHLAAMEKELGERRKDDARFAWMAGNVVEITRKFFLLKMTGSDERGHDHIDITMWEGWESTPKVRAEIPSYDWRAAIDFVIEQDRKSGEIGGDDEKA